MKGTSSLHSVPFGTGPACDSTNGEMMTKKNNRFPLKFPEGMRERILAHARANYRTMNAEVIHRLESVEALQLEVNRLNQALDLFVKPMMESAHV
ncbi:hypothetical protein ALP05_01485 [Pseudomonas caricapapayae]|uniref:Arc-like DNA binding domain-containing protein n=1 Tax=Pseudomonas caricapapayae TaxID=46678 RepID=A0A3M6EYF6_9PSED|nr:Arc family DNA-binding protein [Pseudomonas caricapapayae]RMV73325.1 hypothetical protein ALP05_01485 [Pseudomonas caricapapayae]